MRITFLVLLAAPLVATAQTPLPYSTGFDNAGQQAGWTQYRTGHLSTSDWGYSAIGSPSAPNHLYHDYPVGGASTDTVRDWYVSPPFDFSTGATLTCKVNVYTITGSTMPSDGLKVMLLTGSANPALATVTELYDLLPLVTSTSTYTQLTPIAVPATAGSSRIAFFYQATNNWNTPGIDDVVIAASGVGITEQPTGAVEVNVFPNPGTGPFTLEVRDARYVGRSLRLQLYDKRGALVAERNFRDRARLDVPMAEGTYVYLLRDEQGMELARGLINALR